MALFFLGYLISITSTIAFIVAILTPRWIYPNIPSIDESNVASPHETNYRGIFYVDAGFLNHTCRDWILTYKDSVAACRPPYAVACASLSIVASSLSIILIWFTGGYLYIRRRRLSPHFVTMLILMTLIIFWLTSIVWIVMVTMNRDANLKIRTENIGFSMWLAVGASCGYLFAFVSFVLYRIHLSRRISLSKEVNMNSRRF